MCSREQEARFADTPWTREGEQAHLGAAQLGRELHEFVFAPKLRGQWQRQAEWWWLASARDWSGWQGKDVGLHR
jgi:hypothetical protein